MISHKTRELMHISLGDKENADELIDAVDAAATVATADIHSDGSVDFSADQSMGGNKLVNVADPIDAQDAATKAYVDSHSGGTPGGGTGSVQFNNSSAFAGTNNLFWDNTNGRLGINNIAPSTTLSVSSAGTTNLDHGITQENNATAAAGANLIMKKSRGTSGSKTAIQSGDSIGKVMFYGYGTAYGSTTPDGMMQALAAQTFSGTAHGTTLSFQTTPLNSIISRKSLDITFENNLLLYSDSATTHVGISYPIGGTTYSLILPANQGTGSLTNDGAGNLSWASAGGGLASKWGSSNAYSSTWAGGSSPAIVGDSSLASDYVLQTSDTTDTTSNSAEIDLITGTITNVASTGHSSEIDIATGDNNSTAIADGSRATGNIEIFSGHATSGFAGDIRVTPGLASSGNNKSGDLKLITNIGSGTGANGKIQFQPADSPTPTPGFIWTATDSSGSGSWMASSASVDPLIFANCSTFTVTGGASINLTGTSYIELDGALGPITLDATEPVVVGSSGQYVILRNTRTGLTDTITFPASSLFNPSGSDFVLKPGAVLNLVVSVDGSHWDIDSFTGASDSLNNLRTTEINVDLVAAAASAKDIGTNSVPWRDIYAGSFSQNGNARIEFFSLGTSGALASAGNAAITWGADGNALKSSDGVSVLDFTTPGNIDLLKSVLNNVVIQSGTTGSRPGTPVTGQMYFDTDLAAGVGKPIWWSPSAQWVDAAGVPA